MQVQPPTSRTLHTLIAYAIMVAGSIALYLWVLAKGGELTGAGAALTPGRPLLNPTPEVLPHVLLALVVVIVMARAVGFLFQRLHQPAVIGEVIAGIMLGPSLLGRLAPGASGFLLPPSVALFLGVLAQIGVILFMFLVGLQLDTARLRGRAEAAVAISHASILAPLLLGAVLAIWLFPLLAPAGVSFTVFALFLGVSMSVTAFPVLARILTDLGMQQSQLGSMALAIAAVDDVSAWCLLALVVSVVHADTDSVLVTLALTAGFIVAMIAVGRPCAHWFVRWHAARGRLTQGMMSVVCVAMLLCALATEAIGIHALFGAFLLGALVPHGSALAREIAARLEDLVVVLLLPAFFAFTGLRTQIGLVDGLEQWGICLMIVLVACLGKFGGSVMAARLTGIGWRDAVSIGVLLNTRGLMELIALNVGLDLGVISPALFTMLVLMALVTTFATTPVLHWLGAGKVSPAGRPAVDG